MNHEDLPKNVRTATPRKTAQKRGVRKMTREECVTRMLKMADEMGALKELVICLTRPTKRDGTGPVRTVSTWASSNADDDHYPTVRIHAVGFDRACGGVAWFDGMNTEPMFVHEMIMKLREMRDANPYVGDVEIALRKASEVGA